MLIAAIVFISFGTVYWVAWPLFRAPRPVSSRPQRSALELQREKLLRELKELEFDRRMGKIDMAEYTPLRAELAAQAAQVLKQIEARRATVAPAEAEAEATEEFEAETIAPSWEHDVEIEILIARARLRLAEKASSADESSSEQWRCECGREMSDKDRFCASCGAPRPAVTAA